MTTEPNSATEQNDSEQVLEIIRQDIISGVLPAGEKLKIVPIRDRYNFGTAPVREALARLAGEGLVVQQSQRGFRVRDISADDVKDLGQMRISLECDAVEKSLQNGTDEWEAKLVAAYHKLSLEEKRPAERRDLEELEQRNRAFHDALVSAANSPWLLELRQKIYAHHERYRYVSRQHSYGKRDTPAEHAAIFEAAVRRDIKETKLLVAHHINLTTVQAVEALKDRT